MSVARDGSVGVDTKNVVLSVFVKRLRAVADFTQAVATIIRAAAEVADAAGRYSKAGKPEK
ncbi:MAG TPA: hypothetical protein VMS08_00145 [Candidatus Saccharimonadia bacterium]|nr:hypothetical protein [Candidatus Saccharimonadia bacterium]